MKYILLPLFILLSSFSFCQTDEQVKQLIFQKDSLFWVAYNNCDVDGMGSVLTDDVEFYHDKGGPSIGKKEFLDGLARFAQLWIVKDGQWKMSRILSYDHGEAPKNIMDEKQLL